MLMGVILSKQSYKVELKGSASEAFHSADGACVEDYFLERRIFVQVLCVQKEFLFCILSPNRM